MEKNVVYIRRGSSTAEANPDEILSMGADAVAQNLTENLIPSIRYEKRPIKLLPFTSKGLIQWGYIGIISGIVGFIYTNFVKQSSFSILFLLLPYLSILLLSWGDALRRRKDARILAGLSLRSNSSGKIFLTETYGRCPFCSGTVKLKAMPKGSDRKVMGICQTNSEQHTFSFDFTTYTGTYYPIVWRKLPN